MTVSIEIKEDVACFLDDDRIAGEYVLNDHYKPYFRSFNSPDGHNLAVVSPADHRHHKGLMYALVADDVCWWEEEPGSGHCGIQEILKTEVIDQGIRQEILWREESGSLHTYFEVRKILLQNEEGNGYKWHWQTRRESLRDHRLKKSRWSVATKQGHKINYHGLGIRLPWMWNFGGADNPFNGIQMDNLPCAPEEAHGTNGPAITWWGLIDGYWTPPKCALRISQEQDFTWFVLKGDFPYLSVGPSNKAERDVNKGECAEESYTLQVRDLFVPG